MKLPQLPREIIRREDEPFYEKEIWQPSWNCFCCEDSGIVRTRLAKMVIQGFNPNCDRIPICQAPGCNAGAKWLHLDGNIDLRLTAAICQEFDRISREDWRQTTEHKFINLKALSEKLAMPGSVERTKNENREIQQRKAEIEAITHEQWLAQGQKYFNELEEYA
ncbi:hypothetical protein [Chroococcus sp. FPU101]|uniref:hypothetical protein n=1 Tax=Chroococcus sp. FPU101 TaxID=1974212 RepID=UPI001A8FA6E3|nr:hypothetical protein [Chroococcus sp. FPU101]GFE72260.1 hypothetical protein CFPU101_48700 [Chroococcus sp. FPU101]